MILIVWTYIRKKSYENVLGNSECGFSVLQFQIKHVLELKEVISNTCSNMRQVILSILYYTRKCKAIKVALCLGCFQLNFLYLGKKAETDLEL